MSIIQNFFERLRGFATRMPTSLPMLPMVPGWQGEASVEEMLRISKETWALVKEEVVGNGIYQRSPVHRLERSIDYVKDRTKTTESARGFLERSH